MKVAVFVCGITYFDSQFALAKSIFSRGHNVIFVFTNRYAGRPAHIHLAQEFFDVRVENGLPPGGSKQPDPPRKIAGCFSRLVGRVGIFQELIDVCKSRKIMSTLVDGRSLSLAILPAENRFQQNYIANWLSRRDVRVVVVPSWFASEAELFVVKQFFRRGLSFSVWGLSGCKNIVREVGGKLVIPKPPSVLALRKHLGYLAPEPWILHSGFAEKILCESEAHRDLGAKFGLPHERLEVSGSLSLDSMFREIEVVREHHSSGARGSAAHRVEPVTVLVAVPYSLQRTAHTRGVDPEVLEELAGLTRSFAGVRFVWHPHPSLEREAVLPFLPPGASLSYSAILRELVVSSAFLASNSSTIAWALALGLPVGNWDVDGFNYADFDLAPGLFAGGRGDLHSVVEMVLERASSGGNLQAWQFPSARRNPYWGVIDGKNEQRIASLLHLGPHEDH